MARDNRETHDETFAPECGPAHPDDVLRKASGENFPVALRLLPRAYRRHLTALYGFARTVDDIGDESPPDERLRLLDRIDQDLDLLYAGQARLPVVQALAPTVAACGVPAEPLRRLIEANRRDQAVTRYATFEELLGYCELSANPVGQIVLHIFGVATPRRRELSDRVCTALQLVEHWQDVAEDLRRGRVYLPAEDLAAFGCTEADLAAPVAAPRVRELLAFEAARARRILDAGAPLVGTLRGFARLAVAGYVAGGRAALAAIAAADHDVLRATPRPGRGRTLAELVRSYTKGG